MIRSGKSLAEVLSLKRAESRPTMQPHIDRTDESGRSVRIVKVPTDFDIPRGKAAVLMEGYDDLFKRRFEVHGLEHALRTLEVPEAAGRYSIYMIVHEEDFAVLESVPFHSVH